MEKVKLGSYEQKLQDISLSDSQWKYDGLALRGLPAPHVLDENGYVKSISLISSGTDSHIMIRLQKFNPNRATDGLRPSNLLAVSCSAFRPRCNVADEGGEYKLWARKESIGYVARLLRTGVELQGVYYHFYGYSNSQLKSRTCLLLAASKEAISRRIESFGDFSKMKTVAKKVKRIGLLFSAAQAAITVEPSRCEDIPGVENDNYVFTDGCGLISPRFAQELSRRLRLTFRDKRYSPSVFQIRYRGYKGVVTIDPTMKIPHTLLKFRKSMKKFSGGEDMSFCVVSYSKPYLYGYLNDEVVILLNSLGILTEVLLRKQTEHFQFLDEASRDPRVAFRFLCYLNKFDLAEKVLMESLETVRPEVLKLIKAEKGKMLNKRDAQKCRILVPKSRLLYGVCDAWGVLKEGECHVKITTDENGLPQTLKNAHVLVTRNPCLHPGDLQKFKLVYYPQLSHLVDCIVFPVCGRRPSADMMSGGDLDGDTFFVCWDEDLMPSKISDPAQYSATREPLSFRPISDDDRLQFFSQYSSASLGRVKNLYLDWVKVKGPMAPECQELNRLFSQSVDGNPIKVPARLENAPKPSLESTPFILDLLHELATKSIDSTIADAANFDGYDYDAVELLLNRDGVAASEFELIQLAFKWCRRNSTPLCDLLQFVDLNSLTAEQKAWTVSQLPVLPGVPNIVMNALCLSDLVSNQELSKLSLDYPRTRWKRIYSSHERMATFLEEVARSLELFHRKLIILRVDERLTIALYVPKKVERSQDYLIDDQVRLFAFPHSQGPQLQSQLCCPTKVNYRLYCDDSSFQLFGGQRGNTWIHIRRGGSDDSPYRNTRNIGDRRRSRQESLDSGLNFDFIVSVALDKFSRNLQQHIGRVNRNGVLAAEIYVITNRDVQSMQTLDLWLKYIDTMERMPLFDEEPKEYSIPNLTPLDSTHERESIVRIVNEDLSILKEVKSLDSLSYIFTWLWERDAKGLLYKSVNYLLDEAREPEAAALAPAEILEAIFVSLNKTPFLSTCFAQIGNWNELPDELADKIENRGADILKGFILSANDAQELILNPLRKVCAQIQSMSLNTFSELIALVALTVHSPDLALDILLECFEPESARLLHGVNPLIVKNFTHNLIGIALDHIGEVDEQAKEREDLLALKSNPNEVDGNEVVETTFRIDSPGGTPERSAHVRLIAASQPTNSPLGKPWSVDALVVSSEKGMARFRCLHPLPPYFEQCSWRLTYCASFVTANAMFNASKSFAADPETCCSIWMQLLVASSSLHLPSICPPIVYHAQAQLNRSQNAAVEAILKYPLVCLWGPPGTGKTQTIVASIIELERIVQKERILVTAPTHNAVDNVMRRYLATSRNDTHSVLRVSTEVRKVAEDLRPYTLDAMAGLEIYSNRETLKEAERRVKKCRLAFTTCIGAGIGLLRNQKFEVVIIDEASQQTEPASLVPLTKGCQRALLVGDHVQLRPTVQQLAGALEFDVSLFERLYKQQASPGPTVYGSEIPKIMLDTQYRMHPSICEFSSNQFYGGNLLTGIERVHRPLSPSMFPWPIDATNKKDKAQTIFIECADKEDKLAQKSKSNEGQARLCHRVCSLLSTEGGSQTRRDVVATSEQSIAVLTPYTRQLEVLKKKLAGIKNIEVSSIDGYQGREADIVVFVTTRCNASCNIGFLKDLRRMNVALTRAKAGMIIIGNRETLTQGTADPESTAMWKQLLGSLVVVDIG